MVELLAIVFPQLQLCPYSQLVSRHPKSRPCPFCVWMCLTGISAARFFLLPFYTSLPSSPSPTSPVNIATICSLNTESLVTYHSKKKKKRTSPSSLLSRTSTVLRFSLLTPQCEPSLPAQRHISCWRSTSLLYTFLPYFMPKCQERPYWETRSWMVSSEGKDCAVFSMQSSQ